MCSFGSNQSAPTTQYSTQSTVADPRAQQMYGQAWSTAQTVAQRPFQPYSYDPNAFVAPMNSTQLTAVNNIAGMQNAGQPYYQAAPGMAYNAGNTSAAGLAGAHMSPYLDSVAASTMGYLNQQQAMDRNRLAGTIAQNGQWGNDRSGIERAVLAGQQGLATANTMSNLYNNGYNTALGAAQTDLNRQLQASQLLGGQGIQGAQSLLQAGTLGQQTQQAGLQALYNQYMMQQQYPFQVAQYLSSTAAGLGPGYGGTTSGYQSSQQPLSFMGTPLSDPRLKTGGSAGEAPEVIGQTHDGQDIYRYRLMDPDTGNLGPVQIGLMADEVEQRRPDAIGDYKGFRTVDYAKATDDAARLGGGVMSRGDYADGGGIDDLLRSHEAMYQGLGKMPGGIVPEMKMAAAKLDSPTIKFADMPKRESYGIGQAAKDAVGLIDSGKSLYSNGKGIYDWIGDKKLLSGPSAEIAQGYEKASGGTVYDDTPEMTQGPEVTEQPVAKLDTPQLSFGSSSENKQGTGIGDMVKGAAGLAGAAKTLWDIGSTVGPALMALSDPRLKTGVRPGYATEGGVEPDDDFLSRLFHQESGGKQFDRDGNPLTSSKGATGIAQIMPGTMPEAARYAGLEPSMDRLRSDPEYNKALGRAYLKHQLEHFGGDREMALGAYNAGPSRVERAVAKANISGGDWKDYLPRETQAYIPAIMGKGLGKAMALAAPEGRPSSAGIDAINSAAKPGGVVPGDDTAPPQGISGFLRGAPASGLGEKALDFATSERFIVPLLTGLGAMASSGSRNLAPAVLQGLGAGAQSFMQVPKAQAETAKIAEEARTQAAETSARREMAPKIHAETQKQLIDNLRSSFYTTPAGGNIVFLADGTPVSFADYMDAVRNGKAPKLLGAVPKDAAERVGQTRPATSPQDAAAPGATGTSTGPLVVTQPEPQRVDVPSDIYDRSSIEAARKERRIMDEGGPLYQSVKKRSDDYSNYVTGEATGARENAPYVKELATTLGDAYARQGWDQSGFKAALRSEVSSFANTLYHALGGDASVDLSKLKSLNDVVNKISTLLATQRSAAGGQHAYAALEAIKAAIPNLEMDPKAGAELTAQLMALQQRAVDRDAHMRAYMKDSNGLAADAADDFTKKSASRYQKEQAILKDLMLNPKKTGALKLLMSGAGVTPQQIEEKIHKWYGKNAPSGMSRYFAPAV